VPWLADQDPQEDLMLYRYLKHLDLIQEFESHPSPGLMGHPSLTSGLVTGVVDIIAPLSLETEDPGDSLETQRRDRRDPDYLLQEDQTERLLQRLECQ